MDIGYITRSASTYGGNWNKIKGQPREYTIFNSYSEANTGVLRVSTLTGALVGNISLTNRNTKFVEGIFHTTPDGSESFSFKLNSLPDFPILRFSKVQIALNENKIFSGYISEIPEQGTKRKNYFEYKGFGTAKLLEKQIVQNDLVYDIKNITVSGSNMVIESTTDLDSRVQVNRYAIVKGAAESNNNISGYITNVSGREITLLNPAAIAQTITIGQIWVLPEEWSGYGTVLISDLFRQIVTTYANELPINYVPEKIFDTTGFTTGGGRVDFHGSTLKKVFDNIKLMLGNSFDLGVDETDSFFLRPKPTNTLGQLHSGWQVQEPDIKLRTNNIINFCIVNRKQISNKNASTTIGATSQDLTSQKKYGLFKKEIEVPSYMSDSLCQIIADQKVQDYKEPKPQINLKNLDLKYYQHGYYNIVSEQDEFIFDLDDFESLTGWNSDPLGVTTTLDNDVLISGAYSTKFLLTSDSNGSKKIKTVDWKLNFGKELFLWVYQSTPSQILRFYFGETSHTENYFDIFPSVANSFFPVVLNISNLGLSKIGEIAFEFSNVSTSTSIYIDRMQVLDFGSIRYRSYTKKVVYKFLTRKSVVDIEFGDDNPRNLEDFMSGVQGQIESSKLITKD